MPESRTSSSRGSLRTLLTEITLGDVPEWGLESAGSLLATVLSDGRLFPCTFAVAAARKKALRLGFVDGAGDREGWAALPDLLRGYLTIYRTLSRETSLVVLFRPQPEDARTSVGEFRNRFWDVLKYLAAKDSQPWPADLPDDPEDARWEFAFHGVPIFVVCNTPAHRARQSRHADGFMITFQPRWVFEGLEPDSPRGAAARRTIRARLRAYDEVSASPHLGNYGDPGNREWRQYFLDDANESTGADQRCPFRATRDVRDAPGHVTVRSAAGRYSVWPAGRPLPRGWARLGPVGSRDECLTRAVDLWGAR